jgi:hypothetical protein
LALTGAVLGAELRARWLRLLLFLALPACLVFNWGSRADFLKQYLAELIFLAVVILAVQQLVRLNMLGLFLIAACTALLASAAQFLAQPNAFYRYNGYLLLLAIIVLFAWPLMTWWLGRNAPQEEPTAPINQNASNS